MNARKSCLHGIEPVWNKDSRLLILGSFPSVRSREEGFFYAHAQNRFWRVLAQVFGRAVPVGVGEKKELLLACGVALWDVVRRCEISGSADGSLRCLEANDITPILAGSGVRRIYANGATAARLYEKYIYPQIGVAALRLPSTSPANAACSFEKLCAAWQVIADGEKAPEL